MAIGSDSPRWSRITPSEARSKPVVSGTALPEEVLSAREIDDAVSTRVAGGDALYTLDTARIRDIQPDLILAQDLCQVCAVPSGAVEEALDVLGCRAEVLSLDPSTLDDASLRSILDEVQHPLLRMQVLQLCILSCTADGHLGEAENRIIRAAVARWGLCGSHGPGREVERQCPG